jgi:hypothetical protein
MLLRIMQVVFGLSFAALWLIVLVKTFAWSCQGETTTLKMVINFLGAGGAPCGSWWIKWITPWGETATIDAPASGERGFAGQEASGVKF